MELSAKSQEFIDNLQLYLMTSGKKEAEINEIVEELTDHLVEAEKNGKNITEITGDSPKAYMESLANEMKTDYKEWLKFIPLVFLSVIAYQIISDALFNELSYTLSVIIGQPIIICFMLLMFVVTFKWFALRSEALSKKMVIGVFTLNFLSTAAFFLLLYFGNKGAPVLVIDSFLGKMGVTAIALLFLIWFSWSSKSWAPFVPLIVYIPTLAVEFLPLSIEEKALYSSMIFIILSIIFILIVFIKNKAENAKTV
ncbi:DUF1048 domain-containing protein [Niallia circulans]|uniref:DUF1048 domain-containing protein n=1 Tax=Niallia circulans TaxID=1397 RepID=A0A553SMJ0_NIACI|nr:DUF1048 domain-containing protein [Niallia circulans]TRZ38210.1 DUF1048 domain-containing protein [Niallia circulans]